MLAAFSLASQRKPQPPVFAPVSSPYATAIYANGIVESDQGGGQNVNIYPEVSGPVTAGTGARRPAGDGRHPLLKIDDSVQKPPPRSCARRPRRRGRLLQELKAQPRKETLAVPKAQVVRRESNVKAARDQYDKRRASYEFDPVDQQGRGGYRAGRRRPGATSAGGRQPAVRAHQGRGVELRHRYCSRSSTTR